MLIHKHTERDTVVSEREKREKERIGCAVSSERAKHNVKENLCPGSYSGSEEEKEAKKTASTDLVHSE